MNGQLPYGLLRDGMQVLAAAAGPLLLTLLVTGVLIGILQAVTQVNDAAASFLHRFIAAILVCWLLGSWMMERMAGFMAQALTMMGNR